MERFWNVADDSNEATWETDGPSRREVAVLRDSARLLRRPDEQALLREMVANLQKRVVELERRHPVAMTPIERWRREHPDDLRALAGQVVAIHPQRGIVASGNALADVVRVVREAGLIRDTVIERLRPVVTRQ